MVQSLSPKLPEPFDLGREWSGIFNLFAALNVMRRRRFLEIVVASTISVGASAAEASIEKKAIAFEAGMKELVRFVEVPAASTKRFHTEVAKITKKLDLDSTVIRFRPFQKSS
jgi:hypothetical protein